MSQERSRYRRFVFASADRRPGALGDSVSITSLRLGRSYRLDPTEFEIARLFDGTRDARAICAAAAELGHDIEPQQLEAFAADLAQADLLMAGKDEPLPVPAQTDAEARAIGWTTAKPISPAPMPNTPQTPPSTAPGSRTAPGLTGTLTNRVASTKGARSEVVHVLPLAPFLPLGWLASIPVTVLAVLGVLLIATGIVGYQLSVRSAEVAHDLGRLAQSSAALVLVPLFGAWLTNLIAQSARAATIRHYTGEIPQFGLTYWLQFFPWFATSTAGVPERADLSTRLRIIGAAMAATLGVVFIALCGYIVFARGGTFLAPILLGIGLTAFVLLLVGINPLLKRDGYSLIATYLKAPDLREQSVMALLGISKPWQRGPSLSSSQLSAYMTLCLVYVILLGTAIVKGPGQWIEPGWGVTALVIVVGFVLLLIYDIYRRVGTRRGSIGNIKLAAPALWVWVVAFVLGALSLFPYTYEPSGEFQILAQNQAEVRALITGEIRQVFVKEGDFIKAGDPLVKLNDDAQIAAVAETQASIISLQHQLALQNLGKKPEEIEEARQQVATAQKKYDFSFAESNRIEAAYRRNAASVQERDKAVGQAAVDREALEVARAHLNLVSSPTREDEIKSLEAQIAGLQATLLYNKQQLAYTEIRAPISGRVVSQALLQAIGHYLNKGDIVAAIQDNKLYAQIYMPEVAMGDLKIGAAVRAKAYAYPGTEFNGVVQSIAPAAQASANAGQSNPQSTSQSIGSYNVIRVLCKVDDPKGLLKPDMTGMAKVSGQTYPAAEAFLRPISRGLMVEIWSWLP